jgi:hypothetical protein
MTAASKLEALIERGNGSHDEAAAILRLGLIPELFDILWL